MGNTGTSIAMPRDASRTGRDGSGGDADELIVAHQAPTTEGRLRSVTLLAEAMDGVAA